MIWIIRHSPKRDPIFHHSEIVEGVGRVFKELLKIFKIGFDFKIFISKVSKIEEVNYLD